MHCYVKVCGPKKRLLGRLLVQWFRIFPGEWSDDTICVAII